MMGSQGKPDVQVNSYLKVSFQNQFSAATTVMELLNYFSKDW